jgi:hypothetical protein
MFKSALRYRQDRWTRTFYDVEVCFRKVGWVSREDSGWYAELHTGGLFPASGRGKTRDAAVKAAIAKVPADAGISGPVGTDLYRVRAWANGDLLVMAL